MTGGKSPYSRLLASLEPECRRLGIWRPDVMKLIPKRWEKHGDFVLLPPKSFQSDEWRKLGPPLWPLVAAALSARRLGRKRKIQPDDFRSPHVELLYGTDGWVEHVDNGVRYHYNITTNMFSIGNVSEKLRVSRLDCRQQTVVDMFAGIGYFTLQYLVHSGAQRVVAIDWNPAAIEALRKNLEANKVSHRCEVLEGDCRKVCPSGIADQVNLGLLPSAFPYYLTGCRALRATGGVLRIHQNVTAAKIAPTDATVQPVSFSVSPAIQDVWDSADCNWRNFVFSAADQIVGFLENLHTDRWTARLNYLGRVKSYAPHVDHLVFDLICRPTTLLSSSLRSNNSGDVSDKTTSLQ